MTRDLLSLALRISAGYGAALTAAGLMAAGWCATFNPAKAEELHRSAVQKPSAHHAAIGKKRRKKPNRAGTPRGTAESPPTLMSETIAHETANGLRRLDPIYVPKGLEIRFPSFSDTVLQDVGGSRSTLDKYGIGFIGFNQLLYAQNVLDTPRKVPPGYAPSSNPGAVAAGNQVYNGERPTFASVSSLTVTFDASHIGIPDGQFEAILIRPGSTWQSYVPNAEPVLGGLSYYQAFADRKIAVEFGIMDHGNRFVGTSVGGSVATTFGPAAAIHTLLGMSIEPTPALDVRYAITDRLYDKIGFQRSTPVNGRFSNVFLDAVKDSPEGLAGNGADQRLLVINEIGYRNDAAPGDPQTWVRIGGLYNSSQFKDFSGLINAPTATVSGAGGLYALADRQLIQTEPGSSLTAYRGIYAGATFEYAPAGTVPVSQYYEARLYGIGLVPGRPTDLASIVYNHQAFSHYLADQLNPAAAAAAAFGVSIPMARRDSNAYTLSYLAHLMPGLYASVGIGYTDHPSALYFRREGSSLNLSTGLLTVF